jgi:hypothetical protein
MSTGAYSAAMDGDGAWRTPALAALLVLSCVVGGCGSSGSRAHLGEPVPTGFEALPIPATARPHGYSCSSGTDSGGGLCPTQKIYDLQGVSLSVVTSWFNSEVGTSRAWRDWTSCGASASDTTDAHYWIWSRGEHDLLTIEASTAGDPTGVTVTLSKSTSGPC